MRFTPNMVVSVLVTGKLFGIIAVLIRQHYLMLRDKKYRGKAIDRTNGTCIN
jgi:hypothetical protein